MVACRSGGSGTGFRLVAAQLTTESMTTFGAAPSADRDLLAAFVSGWNATT